MQSQLRPHSDSTMSAGTAQQIVEQAADIDPSMTEDEKALLRRVMMDNDDDDDILSPRRGIAPSESTDLKEEPVGGISQSTTAASLPASSSRIDVHQLRRELEGYDSIRANLRRLQSAAAAPKTKMLKTSTMTRKDVNLAEALAEQLEECYNTLQKKEEELRLAAEIGQTLLTKVDDLSASIQSMDTRLNLEADKRKKLKDEKQKLKREVLRLQSVRDELMGTAQKLRDQIAKLESTLNDERQKRGRSQIELALEAKVEQLTQEIANLNKEKAKLEQDNTRLLSNIKEDRKDKSELISELKEKSRRLTMLTTEREQLPVAAETVESLQKKNDALQQQLNQTNQLLAQSKKETERLQSLVRSLQQQLAKAPPPPNVEDSIRWPIPMLATLVMYANILNAGAIIVVAIVALAADHWHITIPWGFFIILVAAMWLAYELRPWSFELRVQKEFGFMYNPLGRAVFILLMGLFSAGWETPGYVLAGVSILNAVFNAGVWMQFGNLKKVYHNEAQARSGESTRLPTYLSSVHTDGFGSTTSHEPLLAPLLIDGAQPDLEDPQYSGWTAMHADPAVAAYQSPSAYHSVLSSTAGSHMGLAGMPIHENEAGDSGY